jgi:hypothetical protein
MGEEPLVDEPFDLVHVRAAPWGPQRALTPALIRLQFQFWGLDLPLDTARARRRALDRHGVSVILVPARYRNADLAMADAISRAREAVEAHRTSHPEQILEEPQLYAEHPAFYTFLAMSPDLREQSRIPPGLLWAIDRADGHVWSDQEMERYHGLTAR